MAELLGDIDHRPNYGGSLAVLGSDAADVQIDDLAVTAHALDPVFDRCNLAGQSLAKLVSHELAMGVRNDVQDGREAQHVLARIAKYPTERRIRVNEPGVLNEIHAHQEIVD